MKYGDLDLGDTFKFGVSEYTIMSRPNTMGLMVIGRPDEGFPCGLRTLIVHKDGEIPS